MWLGHVSTTNAARGECGWAEEKDRQRIHKKRKALHVYVCLYVHNLCKCTLCLLLSQLLLLISSLSSWHQLRESKKHFLSKCLLCRDLLSDEFISQTTQTFNCNLRSEINTVKVFVGLITSLIRKMKLTSPMYPLYTDYFSASRSAKVIPPTQE